MQFALNQHKQLVNISQVTTSSDYYCVDCHCPLKVKTSKTGRRFFAHLGQGKHHGQTSEHLLGKQQICQWAAENGWNPQLEYYLPAINQRADIFLSYGNHPVAVEFQCSPLTLPSIQLRNRGYKSLGIHVRWLLGSSYGRRLSPSKIAQFTQYWHGNLVIPFWDIECCKIRYQRFYRTSFSQFRGDPAHLIRTQMLFLHRRKFQNYHIDLLRKRAYRQSHILSCCPLYAHDLIPTWPLFEGAELEWRVAVLLYLETLPIGTKFHVVKWQQLLSQQARWLDLPCLTPVQINRLHLAKINYYTTQLIQAGIVQKHSQIMTYAKAPHWFQSVDQKLLAISGRMGNTSAEFCNL